jgi:hypothetical protein
MKLRVDLISLEDRETAKIARLLKKQHYDSGFTNPVA